MLSAVKKAERQKHSVLKVLAWVFGIAIPMILTYLGLISYFPKLGVAFLDPLDKKDPMTAPLEVSNDGVFTVRNLEFTWVPKNVLYSHGSRVSGSGQFVGPDGQRVRALSSGEKATLKSVLPSFFNAPIKSADLEIIVAYQPQFFPITFHKGFRFGTAPNSDGDVRWFHRPINE